MRYSQAVIYNQCEALENLVGAGYLALGHFKGNALLCMQACSLSCQPEDKHHA